MVEWLLIPPWNGASRSLADWVALFEQLGQVPEIDPDGAYGAVISLKPVGAEGYVEIESDGRVSAINLEFSDYTAEPAEALITAAASAFGWEIIDSEDCDLDDH